MPSQRPKDCKIHAGQYNQESRSLLDPLMQRLPDNQSGAGRHRCAYCAYRIGYKQALEDMQSFIADRYKTIE